MKTAEVIARLDVVERDLEQLSLVIRRLRHDLFETLDNDPDAVVE